MEWGLSDAYSTMTRMELVLTKLELIFLIIIIIGITQVKE